MFAICSKHDNFLINTIKFTNIDTVWKGKPKSRSYRSFQIFWNKL